MPEALNKRAFGKRHSVLASRVTTSARRVCRSPPDGKIKVEAGDAWVAASLDPRRRAAAKPRHGSPGESRLATLETADHGERLGGRAQDASGDRGRAGAVAHVDLTLSSGDH